MVETTDETPGARPSKGFQVNVADIIQHIIVMTCDSADDKKFVFVEQGGVTGAAFRNGASHLGLCPVSGLEVENDEIGKVGPMLVLAAEHKKLVALIQGCGMA